MEQMQLFKEVKQKARAILNQETFRDDITQSNLKIVIKIWNEKHPDQEIEINKFL